MRSVELSDKRRDGGVKTVVGGILKIIDSEVEMGDWKHFDVEAMLPKHYQRRLECIKHHKNGH